MIKLIKLIPSEEGTSLSLDVLGEHPTRGEAFVALSRITDISPSYMAEKASYQGKVGTGGDSRWRIVIGMDVYYLDGKDTSQVDAAEDHTDTIQSVPEQTLYLNHGAHIQMLDGVLTVVYELSDHARSSGISPTRRPATPIELELFNIIVSGRIIQNYGSLGWS